MRGDTGSVGRGPGERVCQAGSVATAKAERLLNLVIALVNAPRHRTALWIREHVAGYADPPTEEAFFRTFERDKTELRDLGIPLQVDEEDGYRILPGEFAVPQLNFTAAEKAALALAGRLWETTALESAGSDALRKIRDAAPTPAGADESRSAVGLLQPRVRTGDPAFGPLYAAVLARRAVTFAYRKNPGQPAETRSVQPWGLVSWAGRWYLAGFDSIRHAQRTFRLSRISGEVRTTGRPGGYRVPAGLDLLRQVADTVDRPADRTALVRLRQGTAAGVRRHAVPAGDPAPPGWDRMQIPMGHLWDTARAIAGNGPDVVVEQPADLREAVLRLLRGAVGSSAEPDRAGEETAEPSLPGMGR